MKELGLVIEDDEDLAIIFAEALQAANYKTKIIRDGKAAQEKLPQITPHVIILDMHLPNIAGTTIFRYIRTNPRYVDTFVVIATADARMAEIYTDMADFVLVKPISFTQLRDLTKRLHTP